MYTVSDNWAKAQDSFLAPEGFVELSCYIPELNDTLVFTKSDLLSFTHQQTGSLVSGELPKNHIEFSVDNSTGRWNPNNPVGLERYLSQRLRIRLRYGFMMPDSQVMWIPGGTFFLSEWDVTANGMEASFVARDCLEHMIDTPYERSTSGSPHELLRGAFISAYESTGPLSEDRDTLRKYPEIIELSEGHTNAVIVQKCANATGCVCYSDRHNLFRVEALNYENTGYTIPLRLSYRYPEVKLSRPLKDVEVTYAAGAKATFRYGSTGETQTVNNDFIQTEAQALDIAKWVCDNLRTRRQISGEFRGDLRLDLFDVVNVETQYGVVEGVVLTDIKHTFNGAFRTTYSGYVYEGGEAVTLYCGEIYTGEVM